LLTDQFCIERTVFQHEKAWTVWHSLSLRLYRGIQEAVRSKGPRRPRDPGWP
jgi:hypothetical protein